MSDPETAARRSAMPPLPRSIWLVAWASLAGQAVLLVRHGVRQDDGALIIASAALGALLVGYVSAGVVRARTVRLVLAWVVLGLGMVGGLVDLPSADDVAQVALASLSLATNAVALAGLASFRRTEWYAWQRTNPGDGEGAPVGRLVAVGVLVGGLGGFAGPVDPWLDVRISAADRSPGSVTVTAGDPTVRS